MVLIARSGSASRAKDEAVRAIEAALPLTLAGSRAPIKSRSQPDQRVHVPKRAFSIFSGGQHREIYANIESLSQFYKTLFQKIVYFQIRGAFWIKYN
jgi:hypothetical protein